MAQQQYKSASTDSLYQSTFLPIFQRAETQIKKTIISYFWLGKSKTEMRKIIANIIERTDANIPKDLPNRDAYIKGMYRTADKLINEHYDKAKLSFFAIATLVAKNLPEQVIKEQRRPLDIKSPKQLIDILSNQPKKLKLNMWAEAKASVRVQNYPKEIEKFLNGINRTTLTTSEEGKKPISLWQKAELDIRHQKQMDMIDNLKEEGVELAWISSHPDCSKRCEKWQGKLVDINRHATMSGFRIEKVDGHWVYSLTDIMDQTDKYGYKNNIINGFNCRHYLIPYQKGVEKPTEYDNKDVAKQREIEGKIREMERTIRYQLQRQKWYETIGETKLAKQTKSYCDMLIRQYKAFCDANGYAWEKYRIQID